MRGAKIGDKKLQSSASPADISSIGIASHELKSPLVLLRQLSLELSSGNLSNAESQRVVDQLIHVSEKALRLTTNLTKAERLQSTIFPLEPVNPLSICEDVTTEIGSLYKAHGRALVLERQKCVQPVVANRDLLRRILLNFADNALHYSDEYSTVRVTAKLFQRNKTVRLSVRDFGPAIDFSYWQRIKATVSSSSVPMSRRPESSGLGIYISRQFADAMGGSIGVIRHRDGASFYVELPVSHQLSLL